MKKVTMEVKQQTHISHRGGSIPLKGVSWVKNTKN